MIGVLLRKARFEKGFSLEELAEKTKIPVADLEMYELGQAPIGVPQLEFLCGALGHDLREFQDRYGPIGVWFIEQRAMQDFKEMPPELQAFVAKPINLPYLELAQRLSEMSVDKLRAVAEGLLEITL
jgi:transcriptional regulator with XRE-family HTH domain